MKVINDPRFEIMLYAPADRNTDDYCLKLMVKTKLKAIPLCFDFATFWYIPTVAFK